MIHSKLHIIKKKTESHCKKSLCAFVLVVHFSVVHFISDSAAVGDAGLHYCDFLKNNRIRVAAMQLIIMWRESCAFWNHNLIYLKKKKKKNLKHHTCSYGN